MQIGDADPLKHRLDLVNLVPAPKPFDVSQGLGLLFEQPFHIVSRSFDVDSKPFVALLGLAPRV